MSLETIRMSVPHVVRGRVSEPTPEHFTEYKDFATPELDLDELVWPRNEPGPAFDLPLAEIIDFLVAVGERLTLDDNEHLQHALEQSVACSELGPRILTKAYEALAHGFNAESLWFQVDREVGRDVLDGWKEIPDLHGSRAPGTRVPAAPRARARRQRTRCHRRDHRPRRALERRAPAQAAVERPVHGHRHPADDGRGRPRPPGDAIVLVRLLAGRRPRGRGRAVPAAVLRPPRRLGR